MFLASIMKSVQQEKFLKREAGGVFLVGKHLRSVVANAFTDGMVDHIFRFGERKCSGMRWTQGLHYVRWCALI